MLEFLYQLNIEMETIEKTKAIIKSGYVPKRGQIPYGNASAFANCFEHACFGFTNEQLLENFNSEEAETFGRFNNNKIKKARLEMFELIKACGLEINRGKYNEILKGNQWKISLYFGKLESGKINFHFVRQERNGTWSGKDGYKGDVKLYDFMPERFTFSNTLSTPGKVYIITNPYAEEKEQ